jgi:protein SCO1/2
MPLSERTRRIIVPLAAFAFGLGVLALSLFLTLAPGDSGSSAIGGPFTLVDQDGRTVTEKDVTGRPYLVFFGFTHCPDVCPTTLFRMSEVLKATGEKGQNLRALFISVDPERDRPETLKSYLSSFDERITGLTGDETTVAAALKTYRAYARKVPTKDGDYTMEHTSYVYLMDRRNRFVGSQDLGRPPEDVARDLQKHL